MITGKVIQPVNKKNKHKQINCGQSIFRAYISQKVKKTICECLRHQQYQQQQVHQPLWCRLQHPPKVTKSYRSTTINLKQSSTCRFQAARQLL